MERSTYAFSSHLNTLSFSPSPNRSNPSTDSAFISPGKTTDAFSKSAWPSACMVGCPQAQLRKSLKNKEPGPGRPGSLSHILKTLPNCFQAELNLTRLKAAG